MSQLEKNTVKADKQLKSNEYITFTNLENSGKRIMFLGNSITLHGIAPHIGWNNFWGMAASAEERDYVHLMEKEILKKIPDAAFCICQGSRWEIDYKNGKNVYPQYEMAKDFCPDIIIVRIVENCSGKDFDSQVFKKEYVDYIKYLGSNSEVILTTSFWKHPADESIREVGKEMGWQVVELGDLGEDDDMKAIGLFEHGGVANHPGDKGMAAIAERISSALFKII